MNNKFILSALATTGLVMFSASAEANILGGTTSQPSAIEKRFDSNSKSRKVNEIVIKDEREQDDVEGADEIKLDLKAVEIEGSSVIDDSELEAIYAPYVGKEVSLADIYQIRDLITKKYREEGYVLSRAILPPQRIKTGNVKYEVIEGRLNNVSVQGEIEGDRAIIDGYINKIKTDGPLNSANLERYLLLIDDLYGVTAKGTLLPADGASGAADLVISLTHKDVSGVAVFDNSGTRFVGENLLSGEVGVNSALGQFERISFRGVADTNFEDVKFGDITYQQAIGEEGTEIRVNAGLSSTSPGSTLSAQRIHGVSKVVEAEIIHPYIRSRRENLTFHGGLTVRNVDSDANSALIFKDQTRVLTLGATYDLADEFGGVNVFDFTVSHGIDGLGASDDSDTTSRLNGSASFTKFNLEASREQSLGGSFSLLLAGEAQLSTSALFVGEEFSIGGSFGRGYDFSEFTGDSGAAGKIELQYGLDIDAEFLNSYQLYTFYDLATVWQHSTITGGDDRSSLSSVGVGTRVSIVDDVSGYVQLSKPLTADVASEGDNDPRIHFGLNYVF